jgi:methyl-accepting chemotaxis protein
MIICCSDTEDPKQRYQGGAMKIGARLVIIISVFNIIGIGILASVTLFESRREISRLADEQARTIAIRSSDEIKNWFDEYMNAVKTIAKTMEGYKEIPAAGRRAYFNMMMRQVLAAHPRLGSVYANWSPNGLDGLDAEYANTPGTDGTGRYISAWIRIAVDDEPLLTAIEGFSWDMVTQMPGFNTEYILDPAAYEMEGMPYLIANMGVPVKDPDTGAIIGLVGATLELPTIQSIVGEIKPFGNGYALAFSSGGIVAAHTDPERLGMNMRDSESDTFGPYLDTMTGAVATGTPVSFSYRSPKSDTVIQYYSAPFTIGQSPTPWTLVVGVSHNTIMAPVYRMLLICVIIGAISIVMMSAGVIFTARSISRPIAHTINILKDIAGGDLTKEIDVRSRDELGDLARYLNLMVDGIKNLVLSIRKEAGVLSQTGTELAGNITGTSASISEIAANIQSLRSRSGEQESSVSGTGKIMEEVVENIELLNGQIQKQTDRVGQSSSAVEEMLANIQGVTQTLMNSEGNIIGLREAAEIGRSGLEEVSGNIQEIERESAGLLEINAVMENIASQTNLLSMNAAIEAAHAGEAGKGFAVVSGEIRKLAESSSAQSKTISVVLKKIKDSIDKITKSTEGVLLKFEAISDGVRKVTDQEANVRSAMEEQGAGSKSILESISSLNEITGEVTGSARAMESRSQNVIKESRALAVITKEIGEGMREMTAAAEQISGAVKRVGDISVYNKTQIETLISEISRFKVEG